jgi:hypothetical protein
MTQKNATKIAARARQAQHGGKYMAHLRIVEGGERQMIRAFHVEGDGMTFSARCAACGRWIWCGEEEHDGVCFCGHPYTVCFGDEDWGMLSKLQLFGGWRCMDCGAEFKPRVVPMPSWMDYSHIYPRLRAHSPWHAINETQQQCNRCDMSSRSTSNAVAVRKIPFRLHGLKGDEEVGVRCLTREEYAEATLEADRGLVHGLGDEIPLTSDVRGSFDTPEDAGIVARAFRDANDPTKPAFPSADWVSGNMSGDEVKAFVGFYFETIRSL